MNETITVSAPAPRPPRVAAPSAMDSAPTATSTPPAGAGDNPAMASDGTNGATSGGTTASAGSSATVAPRAHRLTEADDRTMRTPTSTASATALHISTGAHSAVRAAAPTSARMERRSSVRVLAPELLKEPLDLRLLVRRQRSLWRASVWMSVRAEPPNTLSTTDVSSDWRTSSAGRSAV